MSPVAVCYATREGQTRIVAERVATLLRDRGLAADVFDISKIHSAFSLEPYVGAILAASVHLGRHDREMISFVTKHRAELGKLPTAFLSISLSEAEAEREAAPADERAKASDRVTKMLEQFYADTGWHPTRTKPVAGTLAYSRYNFLVRFVMKRIARAAGMPTDTTHDYEYTDWAALDGFARAFADELTGASHPRFASASANVVS